MAHARNQIRNQFVTLLTGLSTTGNRVFTSRTNQRIVAEDELPCLLVYYDSGVSEQSEHDADDKLQRELRLVVKGCVKEAEDAEDLLDQIAVEVETAVTRTVGSLAIDCILSETRFVWPDDAADKEIGALELVYAVLYRTVIGAPETSL